MTANAVKKWNNLATGRIKGGITAVATTIPLYPGDAMPFRKNFSSGDNIFATITDNQGNREIVLISDIPGEKLTVSRQQDGSTGRAWGDGAIISQRLNAGYMDSFIQKEAFRTVTVNPNGVYSANYRGEKIFHSGQDVWWKSISGIDWQLIAGVLSPEFTWTKFQDFRSEFTGSDWQLTYDSDGDKYYLHGGQNTLNDLAYSTDGLATAWVSDPDSRPAWLYALEYSEDFGLFLGYNVGSQLGTGLALISSPDITNWTSRWAPGGIYIRDIKYDATAGIAVAVGGSSGIVATSPDGINWTQRTSNTTEYLRSVAYSPTLGLWCAVGDDAAIITSPDGVTAWTVRTPDPGGYGGGFSEDHLTSIAWGDGVFVVGGGVDGSTAYVQVSTDGINWTAYEVPNSARVNTVIYAGNKFVGTGDADSIVYSKDGGQTWTQEDLSSYNEGTPLTWSGDMAYSAGNSTLVMESGYCLLTANIGG